MSGVGGAVSRNERSEYRLDRLRGGLDTERGEERGEGRERG